MALGDFKKPGLIIESSPPPPKEKEIDPFEGRGDPPLMGSPYSLFQEWASFGSIPFNEAEDASFALNAWQGEYEHLRTGNPFQNENKYSLK